MAHFGGVHGSFETPTGDEVTRETSVMGAGSDEEHDEDPVPATLGRFAILDEVGSGGMGRVFRAYDPDLRREVAVKLLRGSLGTTARLRFIREAQTMAKVSHPNIVTVFEVGEQNGRMWLAMEFVRGETLRAWIKRDQPDVEEILDAFRQVALGLAAAHDVDLVHRDFKPANVLVGEDGRVRVTDFGLAKLVSDLDPVDSVAEAPEVEEMEITVAGVVMGTPPYMSPEQHLGLATTAAADQFAFGVALWEALCGKRPFRGGDLRELARKKAAQDLPDWNGPSRLEPIVRRMLAARAEDRHGSMDEVAERLAPPPAKRPRALWAAGALAAAAALAVGLSQGGREGPVCDEDTIEAVWNEDVERELQTEFADTGLPYAPDAVIALGTRLDRYARAWRTSRVAACSQTELDGEEAELGEMRIRCLDRAKTELAGTVEAFRSPTDRTVRDAVAISRELMPIEDCNDPSTLRERYTVPPPETREAVAALTAEIDDLEVRIRRRDLKVDDLPHFAEVAEQAEELEHPPLTVLAHSRHARARGNLEDWSGRDAAFVRAYDVAMQAGLWNLARDMAVAVAGGPSFDPEGGRSRLTWVQHAKNLEPHARTDPRTPISLELAASDAYRATALARPGKALEHSSRALALVQAWPERDDDVIGRALRQHAECLYALQRWAEAFPYYAAAAEVIEREYGPRHPLYAGSLLGIGLVHQANGDAEEAYAIAKRVNEIFETLETANSGNLLVTRSNLAYAGIAAGEFEHARELLEGVLEHPEVASRGPAFQATVHTNYGDVLDLMGDSEKGLEHIMTGRKLRQEKFPFGHWHIVYSEMMIGRVSLSLGEPKLALEALERGFEDHKGGIQVPLNVLAEMHLYAYEALDALGRDEEARDELEVAWSTARSLPGVAPRFRARLEAAGDPTAEN